MKTTSNQQLAIHGLLTAGCGQKQRRNPVNITVIPGNGSES